MYLQQKFNTTPGKNFKESDTIDLFLIADGKAGMFRLTL